LRTAIVTGAQGFLGQYIAAELLAAGWNVIGLDRTAPSQEQVSRLRLPESHTIDLRSGPLESLLSDKAPSLLVHAAGNPSVADSIADPSVDFESSVLVLFRVLEAIRRCSPACRVVLLSSAAIYGNPEQQPIREDVPPRPISPYAFHKLVCETLIEEFHVLYGMPTCSVRVFSAYGCGLRRRVLWDICQKALRLQPFELSGTGNETRDFIDARDVAQGVRVISERAAFEAEAYNLASGQETRIADLARAVVEALGTRCEFRFSGIQRAGDPLRWCADVARISTLGYRPQIQLEQGVREYVEWAAALEEHNPQEGQT